MTRAATNPLVSVVIPTRNRPHLLGAALASVAEQTIGPDLLEAVVVNDAGADVGEPVAEAATQGLAVRTVELPRRVGLAGARNAGVAVTRGRYLAFLDDDDLYLPRHLQVAVAALADSGLDCVYTSCMTSARRLDARDEGLRGDYVFDFPFCPDFLSVCMYIPANAVVYRTLREVGASFDETLPSLEDWDMMLRLVREERFRVGHVDEITAVYHRIVGERTLSGDAESRRGTQRQFAQLTFRIWRRWPTFTARAEEFRRCLARACWTANLASGDRPLSMAYYQRCLALLAEAWHGHASEEGLFERLVATWSEEPEPASAPAR